MATYGNVMVMDMVVQNVIPKPAIRNGGEKYIKIQGLSDVQMTWP